MSEAPSTAAQLGVPGLEAQLVNGLGDLLLKVYTWGVCLGWGIAPSLDSDTDRALFVIVQQRYFDEFEIAQVLRERPIDPSDVPAWLRAYAERQIALGGVTAPIGGEPRG